jgi:hypothetical protein
MAGSLSASTVLSRAGAELEAVTAVRQKARLTRRWHSHVWKTPGSDDRMDGSDSELAGQRAALAALLEVTLAAAPVGSQAPDDIEWGTLLALAELYVQATIRSDGLRWNVNGDATQISDSYEVTGTSADTPILDLPAFNQARQRFTRPIAAVTADVTSVGTTLGLDGRQREVKGLFVNRRPVPAAFVTPSPIEFAVLNDLPDALASNRSKAD